MTSAQLLAADTDGWPTVGLIGAGLVVLGLVILFVAAALSIMRASNLSSAGKLVWIAIVLVLQVIGPIAWFFWGRHQSFDGPGDSRIE